MNDVLIGALSSLAGAIIGAIASYLGCRAQIKHDDEVRRGEEIKNRNSFYKILSILLKQEMEENLNYIIKFNISEIAEENIRLKDEGKNDQYYINNKDQVVTKCFEDIKWKLINYADDELVKNIISIYSILYCFKRGIDLKDIDKTKVKEIADLKNNIMNVLNLL